MLGNNAIYLARHISTWRLHDMNEHEQILTLKKNKVIVDAFKYALDDMYSILFYFLGNHNRLNLYGFKMKFDGIQFVANNLCTIIDNDTIWYQITQVSFERIAEDLETITNILDYEINHNLQIIDSRDKNYSRLCPVAQR